MAQLVKTTYTWYGNEEIVCRFLFSLYHPQTSCSLDVPTTIDKWLNLSKAQGNGGGPPTLKFEDGTKKHNKTITRGHRTPSPVGHWRKVENNKLPWGQSDCDGGGTGGGESARGRRQIEIKVRPPQAQVFDGARSCCVCVPSSVTGREAPLLAKGLTAGHAHATEDIPILRSLRSVSLCGTPLCPLRVNEVPCYPGNLHGPRWVNNTQWTVDNKINWKDAENKISAVHFL